MLHESFLQIGYLLFLISVTYTVLVKMTEFPTILEWYAIAYVTSLLGEVFREVRKLHSHSLSLFKAPIIKIIIG